MVKKNQKSCWCYDYDNALQQTYNYMNFWGGKILKNHYFYNCQCCWILSCHIWNPESFSLCFHRELKHFERETKLLRYFKTCYHTFFLTFVNITLVKKKTKKHWNNNWLSVEKNATFIKQIQVSHLSVSSVCHSVKCSFICISGFTFVHFWPNYTLKLYIVFSFHHVIMLKIKYNKRKWILSFILKKGPVFFVVLRDL